MPESTQATVVLECPTCHARLRLPASAAGKNGRCPKCAGTIHVPEASPGPGAPTDAPIKFKCEFCSRSLKVPAKAAGHRVRCPGCQGEVKVPGAAAGAGVATATTAAPPAEPDAGGFGDDLLSGLAGGDAVTPGADQLAARQATLVPCPSCAAGVSATATVCTACGYNLKTGKKARAASTKEGSKVLGAAGAVAKAGGRFALGCGLSAAGALVGAGIWFGVAYATHYEIGWIAWGVGVLAGLGMLFGYGKPDVLGGLVAAGMAIGAIMLGKLLLFHSIFGPMLAGADHADGTERQQYAEVIAYELMEEPNLPPNASEAEEERAYDAAHDAALARAKERVSKMTDEEVRGKLKTHRDEQRELGRKAYGMMFWSFSFGLIDIVFFVLAIATAFKLGAMGTGGSDA